MWFVVILLIILSPLGYIIYHDNTPEIKAEYAASILKDHNENERSRNEQLKQTPGMEDCTYHNLNGINVIRCPHSSTTTNYQCGKGCIQNNTLIDQ